MRIKFFLYLLVIVGVFGLPLVAQAHVLQSDGTIGAVMHIDPEDDPVVAQPATFYFEFKDTTNRFNLADCVCTVTINRDRQPLFTTTLSQPSFVYTFPNKAVYGIDVTGQPKTNNAFQRFTLHYDLRVSREGATTAAAAPSSIQQHAVHYVLFGVGFLVIVTLYLKDKYKAKKKRRGQEIKTLAAFIVLGGLLGGATHMVHADNQVCPSTHTCCFITTSTLAPQVIEVQSVITYRIVSQPLQQNYQFSLAATVNNKSPPAV